MITFSIIQKSQLEGASRIDAEYYQPEYLEFAKRLISVGEIPLGNVAFITDGQHGYHIVDPNSEIRHITAKNVLEWLVNDNDADRLSIKTHNANKRSNLEVADLLLSTAGTIGAVGIVQEDILPANIDQDVARVHILNQKEVDPYFLIAFLNSKYGQFQLIRETTGQIQTHVSLEKIKNRIFVPIPEWQDAIASLVKTALNSLRKSRDLYYHAEDLLLKELGLKNIVFEDELSYFVNFSDIARANRMDAEYFQPKYQKLIEKIKSQNVKPFAKVVENISAQFNPRPDESYKYVDLGNISSSSGIIDGFEEILGKEAPSRAKRILKAGDVIVSSVEGSLGKVALVNTNQENYLASTGFFQFRSKEILPEVLLVLAKSIVLQMQFQKHCAGTILTAVPNDALKQMYVPVLEEEVQKEIAELVRKSHETRKKSKELLGEAKRKVEEMIEKDNSN